jgi:pimeloyl-ACP methyl ester carboxylesterase
VRPPLRWLGAGAALAALAASAVFGALWSRRAETRHPPGGRFVGPLRRRIHFVQRGSGADVVLIHGTALTLDDMIVGPFDTLAAGYRVTAIDRPGHGYSDACADASAEAQAGRIRDAVQALGLVRPVLLGHSLGAAVALAYAMLWPDEIAGMVVVAPLAYPDWTAVHLVAGLHAIPVLGPALSRTIFAVSDPLIAPLACRFTFAPRAPTRRFRRRFPMALTTRPRSTCADGRDVMAVTRSVVRLSPRYRDLQCRVAVLVGENDLVLSPRRHGVRLASVLGDRARLDEVRGQGHMVHHFEPARLVTALAWVRFVRET